MNRRWIVLLLLLATGASGASPGPRRPGAALIVVDLQNDFMPGGALAVRDADQVVPLANRLSSQFDVVVATQDWHPANHASFADSHPGKRSGDLVQLEGISQVLWPAHCVQETEGAAFHPSLDLARIDHVVRKGTDPEIDSYSGFFDNGHRKATGLARYLHARGVHRVYVIGVATDYCVKFTALDANQLGFATYLIQDACRGVDLKPGDVERAVTEMRAAGVEILQSRDL